MRTFMIFFAAYSLMSSSAVKLPSLFEKCNRKQKDFDQCLTKAVQDAFPRLDKPVREVGLPSLEPLEIPSLTIEAGDGPVGVRQDFKSLKIHGYTKMNVTQFNLNLEKKTLDVVTFLKHMEMHFQYELKGKILALPVVGKGPGSILFDNVDTKSFFTLETYQKNGKKFLKVIDCKFSLEPHHMTYNFENLFDGEKLLGDNINKVMNDNWAEVFQDVKQQYQEAFAQVYKSIFNEFLSRVSISEMFD